MPNMYDPLFHAFLGDQPSGQSYQAGTLSGALMGYPGRPIMRNPDESISTHLNMIQGFSDPSGQVWHYLLPTMYGGRQYNAEEAGQIAARHNFIDPDTGQPFPRFRTPEEAHEYERNKHMGLEELARMMGRR